MKKYLASLPLTLQFFLTTGSLNFAQVFAQATDDCPSGQRNGDGLCISSGITNPAIGTKLGGSVAEASSGQTFFYYFLFIWRQLITIGGFLVLIYFLQAAFEWITANGEASKITSARNKMTGAFAGFLVLVGSFVIIEYLSNLFQLNLLKNTITIPN